ncbi:unnamed protein product [Clonostachys chloroleuca]|uniref:Alcohol dehydrogenase iron-type/glycerol dehydrogenase GldA domain-containing protein n=1 Tax=Clonostachys chloroleuca TaxID=1926264 RepID=A0AA35QEJ4_9HYPO|nr:unnamed protein product [Clonostachys chloroleuca]
MTRSSTNKIPPSPLLIPDPDTISIKAIVSPSVDTARTRGAVMRTRPRPRKRSRGSSPHVIIGQNAISSLRTVLARLHLSAPLIVSNSSCLSISNRIQSLIRCMDSQVVTDNLSAVASVTSPDCVISVGGEFAHALAQSVGLRDRIPHICIPTTYSGRDLVGRSERWRYTDNKSRAGDATNQLKLHPTVIIYDDNLTKSTTAPLTLWSDANVREASHRAQRDPERKASCWNFLQLPVV